MLAEIRTSCFQILGVESFDESDDEMMLDASDVKPAASRAATKTKKVQAVEQPKLKMKKEEQRQEPSPEMKVKVETKEQNDPVCYYDNYYIFAAFAECSCYVPYSWPCLCWT